VSLTACPLRLGSQNSEATVPNAVQGQVQTSSKRKPQRIDGVSFFASYAQMRFLI
jgi:hypothetical protein